MLIVIPNEQRIITAVEGTGDNLLAEDRDEGYRDYWLSSLYEQDGEELNIIDCGQVLTTTLISKMTPEERAQRIMEYWEVDPNEATVIY